MRTTASWAFKRRLQYGSLYSAALLLILGSIYLSYFKLDPTCFDGRENGNETGRDCGGSCVRICSVDAFQPSVRWAKSFRISEGRYNAVAYVENNNQEASTAELKYTFKLYDREGLIIEIPGSTVLPPDSVYPVFAGAIETGNRVPEKTFLELEPVEVWQPATGGRDEFAIVQRQLSNVDSTPILDATLRNESLVQAKDVEVIATLFNIEGTPLTSSRTTIENFVSESERDIVFTWREPIAATIRSCEIPTDVLLAIDISGSMNDDGDNPPEPITSVLEAADNFVGRLREMDQAGVVTFATESIVQTPLQPAGVLVSSSIKGLTIPEAEETGVTNTGEAFLAAIEEFDSERTNPLANKVMVLLTDGLATAPDEEPEEYAVEQAAALKARGITVYTIGLGENVNMDFLRQLASEDSFAYQALNKEQVDQIYRTVTSDLCESGPTVIDIVPKTDAFFKPL